MKNVKFLSLHLIDRLSLLRRLAKDADKRYKEQSLKFQNFIEEIDDCYPYNDMTVDQKIVALNVIIATQDDLLNEIIAINELVDETRAQLIN